MRAQRLHERDGGLVAFDAVRTQPLHEVLVFPAREALHGWCVRRISEVAWRQFYSARFQKRCNPIDSRFAVDMAGVVGLDIEWGEVLAGGRGARLQEFVEQFLPRRGMDAGGVGEHAVEVEKHRVVVARGKCDDATAAVHELPLRSKAGEESALPASQLPRLNRTAAALHITRDSARISRARGGACPCGRARCRTTRRHLRPVPGE